MGQTFPSFIATFVTDSDEQIFDVSEQWAITACVRALERTRLSGAAGAPAGIK